MKRKPIPSPLRANPTDTPIRIKVTGNTSLEFPAGTDDKQIEMRCKAWLDKFKVKPNN